jgi:hypothetical protein
MTNQDYFLSHSWYDNPEAKMEALRAEVKRFRRKHPGRTPTFWLDKVCIDQSNISDGLKVLPINIMASRQLLVLFGDTYVERLWCVWEMMTICFLSDNEVGALLLRSFLLFFWHFGTTAQFEKKGGGKNKSTNSLRRVIIVCSTGRTSCERASSSSHSSRFRAMTSLASPPPSCDQRRHHRLCRRPPRPRSLLGSNPRRPCRQAPWRWQRHTREPDEP